MKRKLFKLSAFVYFFACSVVMLSGEASAYIDPSTTTYIIQAVAAVAVTIGASITIFRHKITAAWRKWYYGRLARKNEKERMTEKKDSIGESRK